MLGFAVSTALRAAFGVLILAVFAVLVWMIEGVPPAAPVTALAAAPIRIGHATSVVIESTYPVATWTVSRLGASQQPLLSDANTWRGTVDAASGDELLVIAGAAIAPAGNRCLRLTIGDAPPRVVWGSGDITLTVTIP